MKLPANGQLQLMLVLLLLCSCWPAQAQQIAPCSVGWLNVPGPTETNPALTVTRPDLKAGRMTIYEGPLGHLGHCGLNLGDVDGMGMVALSPKYLGEFKQPRCGDCVCVRMLSNDKFCNGLAPAIAEPYYGKVVLKALVADRCGECEPDHVDVLLSPAFTSQMPVDVAQQVGIFWSEWNFVNCSTDCNAFFNDAAPTPTPSPEASPTPTPVPSPEPSPIPIPDSPPLPVEVPSPPVASPPPPETPSPPPLETPSPPLPETPSPPVEVPSPPNLSPPVEVPSPPVATPSPALPSPPPSNVTSPPPYPSEFVDPGAVTEVCPVRAYQQCGGLLTPSGVPPSVRKNWIWDGYCCPPGQWCVYRTDTFWQCLTIV